MQNFPTLASLTVACGLALGGFLTPGLAAAADDAAKQNEPAAMTVFKSPYCGCCGKWVEYMQNHGFDVTVRDMDDLEMVKKTAGVPSELESCHTAALGGYVIEGHVPIEAIRLLLREDRDVRGLAVPGMPELLRSCGVPIIAVSPIVGGQALKGPTAKIMNELGVNTIRIYHHASATPEIQKTTHQQALAIWMFAAG